MTLRRFLALILVCVLLPLALVRAEEQRYYMGDMPLNAAKDSGYSGTDPIDSDDIHYGWTLGRFFISGYTRGPDPMDGGDPVFLKNAGDTVALRFRLDQELDRLNGNGDLTLADDDVGFDSHFGTEKIDFGRGTLIIRRTDYQNQRGAPVIYTDYLSGLVTGADTEVELFEEGDYEVALDYSVRYAPLTLFETELFPHVEDYRIFFRFSVRNGNCMVFPFDLSSGAELTNAAVSTGGFWLDLARSRYLDIQVERTVMTDSADGPVADVRFNRPARDGEQYTEEGIYTITVRNRYTYEETVKTIYVGSAELLQDYADSGLFPQELTALLCANAGLDVPNGEPAGIPVSLLLWCGGGVGAVLLLIAAAAFVRKRRERSILDYDGKQWW